MDREHSRRQFLQSLGILLLTGGALFQPAAHGQTTTADSMSYKLSEWTGDDFTHGHQFRINEIPTGFPDKPEKTVDVVIIGGGMAGLSAAYYLRDQDFLLLEQYDGFGGQSRGGNYCGIGYSWGPTRVRSLEGIYGELYRELGLEPVEVTPADSSVYFDKKWHKGLCNSGDDYLIERELKKLCSDAQASFKMLPAGISEVATADIASLDSQPFSALLNGYSPQLIEFLNNVFKRGCNGTVEQVSALAGLTLLKELNSAAYAFPGGNAAVSAALTTRIKNAGKGRLVCDAFVWQTRLTEDGAIVSYTDKDGPHTVACRHLIVASPPMVAWRQIKNLPMPLRAQLMPLRYGSALVVNLLLDKDIVSGTYDNWLTAPFTITNYTNATMPYQRNGTYKPDMGAVLTVQQLWEPGGAGRTLLLAGDREAMFKTIHEQLNLLIDDLDRHLKEAVLTRWGHAMVVPVPGYFARMNKIAALQKDVPNCTLAHSSLQGMPCAESAITAGLQAAQRAKEALSKPTVTVP